MSEKKKPKIFRFKFSIKFLEELKQFSIIHRYDNPKDFKENWETWSKTNTSIIKLEMEYLQNKGYNGDVMEKMYKSARYYFKNKSQKKVEHKKRRVYTRLEEEFLIWMDAHVSRNFNKKPNEAYLDFIVNSFTLNHINNEKNETDEDAFALKIKKTYKNRFYNFNN